MSHHPDDDCARFHPEHELTVLGYENAIIACDIEAGDIFQDPAAALSSRWYEVLSSEELCLENRGPWVHMRIEQLSAGELQHARASVAHEKALEREDAKHDPWR